MGVNDTLCIATNHAYERAKERFGWNHKTLDKMMGKAFNEGICHNNTKGALSKYISRIWNDHKHCNNIRVYGEDFYFFCDNRLITLYRVETKYIKYLKHLR